MQLFKFGFMALTLSLWSQDVMAQFPNPPLVFDDGLEHTIAEDLEFFVVQVSNQSSLDIEASIRTPMNPDTVTGEFRIVDVSEGASVRIDGAVVDPNQEFGFAVFAQSESVVDLQSGSVTGNVGMRLENSRLEVTSGIIGGLLVAVELVDGSLAKISGGSVGNSEDNGYGVTAIGSEIELSGGTITANTQGFQAVGMSLSEGTSLNMSGGEVRARSFLAADSMTALELSDSFGVISGGTLTVQLDSDAWGDHRVVSLTDGADLRVEGGAFALERSIDDILQSRPTSRLFELSDTAQLTISGGSFSSTNSPDLHVDLGLSDESQVTVVGTDFNFPRFEPIADREGTITGTLLDGNEFSWTFEREPNATIILIPEPSAITISVIGFLGLIGCRRKENAA